MIINYVIPCQPIIDTVIDKMYCSSKQHVFHELSDVAYLGMTTDMWTFQ